MVFIRFIPVVLCVDNYLGPMYLLRMKTYHIYYAGTEVVI